MSEEEIINRLSMSAITSNIEAEKYPNCIVRKSDLCNLLNLYNKEKEKNKELSIKLTDKICNSVEVEILEELLEN